MDIFPGVYSFIGEILFVLGILLIWIMGIPDEPWLGWSRWPPNWRCGVSSYIRGEDEQKCLGCLPSQDASGKWRFRLEFPTRNIIILIVTGILGRGTTQPIPNRCEVWFPWRIQDVGQAQKDWIFWIFVHLNLCSFGHHRLRGGFSSEKNKRSWGWLRLPPWIRKWKNHQQHQQTTTSLAYPSLASKGWNIWNQGNGKPTA